MRKGIFENLPDVRYNRSKFPLDHNVKTTMSVGKLYPLDIVEVLPGDSFKTKMTGVMRVTSAFLKPVIDNAFLEVYHFFVPLRLVYNDLEQVFGVAHPSSYVIDMFSSIPVTTSASTVSSGTVGDYLSLPVGSGVYPGISILPFRAFAHIYNDWFRNESITNEVNVATGNFSPAVETLNNNPWSATNYTGQCPYVAKKRDYFTSCLPSPQKGPAVSLALGNLAKLKAGPEYSVNQTSAEGLRFGPHRAVNTYTYLANQDSSILAPYITVSQATAGTIQSGQYYSNIYADMSNVTGINVNDLRTLFQLQKMLEKDARYGSTYREYSFGHFGVVSPDARLQYTEYLGGGRIPLAIQQVAQTSEAGSTPQANVAGYSFTNGYSRFSKGFVEHGYIITVGCIRQYHSYQQGIAKMFMRKEREDFYDPLFANLGEQPVYTSELYGYGSGNIKANVFGYNEAWAEYRYLPNKITGQMRSGGGNSLDIWHFGDYYSSAPTLSDSFILEKPVNVDRTLAVPSATQDNFLVDLWFDMKAIRVMPTYSVPGLVDHH